jgi:hypothetical protein
MAERYAFRGCVIEVVTRKFHHHLFNKTYYDIASVVITRDGKHLEYTPNPYENRDEGEVYKTAVEHAQLFIAARYSA